VSRRTLMRDLDFLRDDHNGAHRLRRLTQRLLPHRPNFQARPRGIDPAGGVQLLHRPPTPGAF
jgi:hypothetical protein